VSGSGGGGHVAIRSVRAEGTSRADAVEDLVTKYARSLLRTRMLHEPRTFPPPPAPAFGGSGAIGRYPTSWFTQVLIVAERAWFFKLRNPDAVLSQVLGTVVISIIIGSVFFRLPLTFVGARDRVSAIAFLVLTQSFAAFDQIVIFPAERAVALRDNAVGAYSLGAFFVGRSLAELPVMTVLSALAGLITWPMFRLRAGTLGIYTAIIVLVTQAGASLLTLIGALSSSLAMGNGLATIALVFSTLFNGFFIADENLGAAYRWIAAISFPGFGVKAAVYSELRGLSFACSPAEAAAGCTGSGDDVLAAMGFGAVDVPLMCGLLLAEIAIFRLLAYLALFFLHTGQPLRERARQFVGLGV